MHLKSKCKLPLRILSKITFEAIRIFLHKKDQGFKYVLILLALIGSSGFSVVNAKEDWYKQGKFKPKQRIEFTISNKLDFDRVNASVIIKREDFPIPDIHEMWLTVVDPSLPSYKGPSAELKRMQGGHQLRAEKSGHAIFHQMDDLDKDGIWDEIFFQTDIKAKSEKTIYIYLGENIRGWNKHYTHANIGSYARHQVPFWESENVGWKIWFANSLDAYAKRKPTLMSQHLYMSNLDGYGVSMLNRDWGSDIQSVATSFGAGAICLFEDHLKPDSASRPRFTPVHNASAPKSMWNGGQISDTRYAYEVIANGPVRSIIKIKGMNWDSGNGFYEYEQFYTVYAKQSYTTATVNFTTFSPTKPKVKMGVGFRKKGQENFFYQKGGVIISSGPESIKDPENIDNREKLEVEFIGSALIVKNKYLPSYQFVEADKGNHTFKIMAPQGNSFEYLLSSAWSEGAVYNNPIDFSDYIKKTELEFNNPLIALHTKTEQK